MVGEITARLNDNRTGPIEKGDLLMSGSGGILTAVPSSRHMGMGSSAQVCIRQVREQFMYANKR